ncbi:hypothetical protein SAMN05216282_10315 [Cryobacterium psychrotolerans]|uniref:Lipoprotein n=1 Tax=Cryobacterium psychrotolerans TaxID=386301 RepID=A0A1G8ZDN9_9MICO|nr:MULTISPECIES: hypothetical protein [Cryobacterium]TFD46051.1 hypothetical protein E3T33_06165 [Cryobacterium sp. TMT1-2-1]TFD87622.1 hypothetical protein E3T56_06170 [Cryobacterium psychrotolerans]SDK12290.1 hypothetical protein SAMN05216282_10315 [Cryobacterium psychrotolerans]
MIVHVELPLSRALRRRFASLAVAILGSTALAGCASPAPEPTPTVEDTRMVFTYDYNVFMQARFETKLEFIANTCVGVTGQDGTMILAVLPHGSQLTRDGDSWLLVVPTVDQAIVIGVDTVVAGGGYVPWGSFGTSDETVPAECRTDEVVQFYPEGYGG